MNHSKSSVELLEQIYAGDSSVMGELLQRHRTWLWSYVRRRMGRDHRLLETSEDIVQDVFCTLIQKGPAFLPQDDDSFRRLVATIVVNRLHDRNKHMRAAKRGWNRQVGRPVEEITRIGGDARSRDRASRVAEREEEAGLLELGLLLIDPEDAAVVRWRNWEELTFADIGQRIGASADAARMRFRRAVLRLGELMRQLEEGNLDGIGEDLDP